MTPLDWGMIAVVAVSCLYSLMRGFVREIMAIIAWIAAFSVAGLCYGRVAGLLTFAENETTRNVMASVLLFMLTLLVVGFIGGWLGRMMQSRAGVTVADRFLGLIIGLARGVLIVCAVMAVIQVLFTMHICTFLQEYDWWNQSLFVPEIQKIVTWFFEYLGNNPNLVSTKV